MHVCGEGMLCMYDTLFVSTGVTSGVCLWPVPLSGHSHSPFLQPLTTINLLSVNLPLFWT